MATLLTVISVVLLFAFQVYTSPKNPNGYYKNKPTPIEEQVKVEDPIWIIEGCEVYLASKGLSTPCGVGSAHDTGNDPEIAFNIAKENLQKKQQELSEITVLESWITANGEFYILVVPNTQIED